MAAKRVAGICGDPCGAVLRTECGWSQVECGVFGISKRGFASPICYSSINVFFWWNVCIYKASQ